MSSRRRLLNRFAIALALAAVVGAARLSVRMFAAPSAQFAQLPDLRFNQGQPVTVAFAAQGFPAGIVYSAEGLPPGLTLTMGVDTLGHVIGLMSGTLAADTPTTSGSEGIYAVRIHGDDGSVSNWFNIDVSHWNRGDVFVGGGTWVYQVYREDGTFKTDVTVPDDPNNTFGSTTGCAVNWRTGEVWATNFDDVYPAVNVITRHIGTNPLPFTDPTRRLSTERYGAAGALTPSPGNLNPFDINPESVAFDNAGNMFVGHSFGFWNDNGDVSDANGVATILDTGSGFVYVDAAGNPILDIDGNTLPDSSSISPAGFFERFINGVPTPILGPDSQPIRVRDQAGMDVHEYFPDQNGNFNQANRQFFDVRYGFTGTDTLDVFSNQTTLTYSSENYYLYRYDVANGGAQLPVVGSNVVGESHPVSTRAIYGNRVLPPGDGTGGYLIVHTDHIERLDANGRVIQMYDVKDDPDYPNNNADGWFAIAIAPDGRTFWAATRQDVYHFDIASGRVIGSKIHATIGTLHTNAELAGLCVMDEYRAAQEVCGPNGTGNGIDDDQDGTIDEGCFRVEICSPLSPGDDDGDGLVDYNDPDCGATPQQQCVSGGPTDNSVGGFCERADYEGDAVTVPGIPRPCQNDTDCQSWTLNYSAAGLPPGLTMDPGTGTVTGIPLFSIVNPNSDLSAPVVFPVTVTATWQQAGQPSATFTASFNWTIYNRNRAPVANDDGVFTVPSGGSVSVDVRQNDSDIDGDSITILDFTQPAAGTGSVVQSGQNLVYTAPNGFGGVATFTYRVQDNYVNQHAASNFATVTVNVDGVPVAVDDAFTTNEDVPVHSTVTGNDTPSGNGGNVWTKTSEPANGTATMNADGTFTYTPNANFHGVDTFTYKVCDIDGDCASATVTITILSVNDVPVAVNDAFTTPEDTALSAAVTGNDTPSGDGGNVWSKTSNPAHGTAAVNADGTFTYTPAANFNGTDSFTYKVCDVDNDCATATVTITITPVNDVPVAVNDAFTTAEDTPVSGSVTGNDTPSGDGGNVWSKTSNPAHGTATVNADGTFTYTPALNFNGTDSFTYKVCDVDNDCSSATVSITITPVNDPPVAVNDLYNAKWNTLLFVPDNLGIIRDPSGQDSDPDNQTLSVIAASVTQPANGTVAVNADGSFNYMPNTGFFGTDTFTYQVTDGLLASNTATVTIIVHRPPVGVDDFYTTPYNTALTVAAPGVMTNDFDPEGGSISIVMGSLDGPHHGVLTSMQPNGAFVYTPANGYFGTDTYTYRVTNGLYESSNTTVTITIPDPNHPPVAVDDYYTGEQGVLLSIPAGAIMTNDSDPDGDAITATLVSNPVPGGGTFVFTPVTGAFQYTSAPTFSGDVTFTYKVTDSHGKDSAPATVHIHINAKPKAVNDAFTTNEDTALSATVTGNDTPSTDGGNVWTKTSNPANGTAVMNADGTFTYTPAANFHGTDSFAYKVCDVDGDCATATVTITILSVNDVPVAVNDAFTTAEDTALAGSVTGNDTPSGDGGNVWSKTSNPANGTATVNADGTFTYTPNANFNGTDSFTYKVCDVDNDCSTATVTITITPVNDVPVAVNDAFTTAEDTPVSGSVTGNDTLSGDGGNVWSRVTNASNGNALVNADGTFTYTPNANFHGTDSFTYKICDVDGDCSTATVTITITSVNDVPLAANDAFTTPEDTPLTGSVTGNDTPSGDGGNVWSKTSNPANGTATVNADGTFTYTPAANFHGTDSFAYKVCDVDGDCASATVTITITSVNDVPVAVNDAFTTPEDTPLTGSVTGNDTPSGDGGNVWTLVTGTANGTVTVNADGTFSYTPAANFHGTDSFTYKVCDVDNDCSTAAVTITITSVNDVPVAVNDAFSTPEDTPLAGSLTGNDTPSGDGGNVWTLVTGAAHGVAIVNPDGTFGYSPAANFNGIDTFTYKVCDVDGDCSTATVTITVISVNDVPLATDDAYTTLEDTAVSGTVITNDSLSGDGGNVWTLVSGTANGTLTFNNGAFTYTPNKNYNGSDSFVYTLCDVNGDCSTATAVITITPVNDVPVAVNDTYSMAPNTSITKDAAANDTPSGDGGNVWTKTSNPASGTVVFNADGTFTYTAAIGFSGVVSFNYKLCDVNNDCSNATVTITIAAIVTGSVGAGDTATIGYWQNQNGQALIKKMNGSAAATNLGNWLASSFPYMWGANAAAANNLTGKTNTQVAAYYVTVFKSDKWTAQVLAGAIASYVTSSTLSGGSYSVPYGFNYSVTGTGTKTYNVGSYGAAIGLANNTSYTVGALLQQANLQKKTGTYNSNAFNVIFSAINQAGDITK